MTGLSSAALERLDYRRRHSGKTCSACSEVLPLAMFGVDLSKTDGLRHSCRPCEARRRREARAAKKAKEAEA
ncbi:hypothetical protein ABIB48_002661 [Arthrobacter sp. UYCu511]